MALFAVAAPVLAADGELRRAPPKNTSPYLVKAEAAARSAYPDIFGGRLNGSVDIVVDLDLAGTVLSTDELIVRSG